MLEVRPVLPAEEAAVGDLLATVYVDEGWATQDEYVADLRDVTSRAAAATVLVAVEGDELLGSVTLAPYGSPYAEVTDEGGAVVRMLVTAPAARGRGAGTALVQACVDRAREGGATHLRLSTQDEMRAAHRIYERFGFRRTPERDWSPVEGLLLKTYALGLAFCSHCGEPDVRHDDPLEPPRWCGACRRRMVVQVTPTGWSARCVQHGTTVG